MKLNLTFSLTSIQENELKNNHPHTVYIYVVTINKDQNSLRCQGVNMFISDIEFNILTFYLWGLTCFCSHFQVPTRRTNFFWWPSVIFYWPVGAPNSRFILFAHTIKPVQLMQRLQIPKSQKHIAWWGWHHTWIKC